MKKPCLNKPWLALCLGLILSPLVTAETIHTLQANLRTQANKDSPVVAVLPQGTTVDLLQIHGQYAEVNIPKTHRTGWVYAPAQGWPLISQTATQPSTLATVPVPEPVIAATVTTPHTGYDLSGGTALQTSELRLVMDPRDAEILFLKDPFDTSTFPVHLQDTNRKIDGEIAVKGSLSRRFLKKSLLITLPKNQTWQGRRRIALNAMATDPTQARDSLTWDLVHKMGMVSPNAMYRRVYLNDRYLGLYMDIEWIDETVFNRFGLPKGEFYQPDDFAYCGDLTAANLNRMETCWNKLSPREGGIAPLQTLAQGVNDAPVETFDSWLDQHFESSSVIDWLVLNTITQNGDTYNKNYFLYYIPATDKWRVIPWDYDLAWGRVTDGTLPFPKSVHNDFFQYLYPPIIGAENPLKSKTLKNPRLYARFQARLKEILTPGTTPAAGWFEPSRFQRRLADIKATVEPSLSQEAYPTQYSGSISTHFEALAFFNEWRYHTLKNLILEPSAFDTPRWLPYTNYDPLTPVTPESLKQRHWQTLDVMANETLITPGQKTPFMEKLLAYPLAFATLRQGTAPVKLTVETDREAAPDRLPPGKTASRCIERTWFVTVKSGQAASVDLQFDYLQESATRHELGSDIQDENQLALWRHDGKSWQKIHASLNPLANYFNVEAQQLEPGILNRYVACQE